MSNPKHTPLERLKHHVTGAIERGEKEAIVSVTTKHTPGPWTVETQFKVLTNVQQNTATRVPYYEVGSDLRRLATVDTGMNDEANARLIAAAPELLEASLAILESIEYAAAVLTAPKKSQMRENIQALKDAIAKATGGAK